MADLVTLTEVKEILGRDPLDTRDDAKFTALIPMVSAAIRAYTERDFGSAVVTEERIFPYDGSGYLDVDDAASISEIRLVVPNSTDVILSDWTAMPARRDDAPVFNYVLIGPRNYFLGSPEMGFTRNLDVYYAERGYGYSAPSMVKVTGTWGWPIVPPDVKLAAVWTLQDWTSKAAAEGLTAEAIEGYSRSWGSRSTGGVSASVAIPQRVRDLLAAYAKEDF
jgi:hypothetical protein